jgi:hypothetical protein
LEKGNACMNALKKGCLRLALDRSQGVGWAEYHGKKWVLPKNNGALVIDDLNGVPRHIIEDRNDNITWEMATYDRVHRLKPSYTDKESGWLDGAEISCEKHFPEITNDSRRTNEVVELHETHFGVRPMRPLNLGDSEYDSSGYRTSQSFGMRVHVDGAVRETFNEVSNIEEDGTIIFSGSKIERRRIQPVFTAAASEFQLMHRSHDCLNKPRQQERSRRQNNKDNFELVMSSGLLHWITGYSDPLIDRVSLNEFDIEYDEVTAPSDVPGHGLLIRDEIHLQNAVIDEEATIMFWTSDSDPVTILGVGTILGYDDAIIRGGISWRLEYVVAGSIPENIVIGLGPDGLANLFDFRIVAGDQTNLLEDYYRDIRFNGGRQYLPVM